MGKVDMNNSRIDFIVNNKINGLYYNNRLILPFSAIFLKIIIEDDIITDFSSESKDVEIINHSSYTEIYFKRIKDLREEMSKYEFIKLIVAEDVDSLFDIKKHKKLVLYLENDHKVRIEYPNENQIIVE